MDAKITQRYNIDNRYRLTNYIGYTFRLYNKDYSGDVKDYWLLQGDTITVKYLPAHPNINVPAAMDVSTKQAELLLPMITLSIITVILAIGLKQRR